MFSVGEIAILVAHENCHEACLPYVGTEVEIVGWRADRNKYRIIAKDGFRMLCIERNLKRKPPYDGNTLTKWDDLIVWKPKEVVPV